MQGEKPSGGFNRSQESAYQMRRSKEFKSEQSEPQKTYADYLKESVQKGQTPGYFLKKLTWN